MILIKALSYITYFVFQKYSFTFAFSVIIKQSFKSLLGLISYIINNQSPNIYFSVTEFLDLISLSIA